MALLELIGRELSELNARWALIGPTAFTNTGPPGVKICKSNSMRWALLFGWAGTGNAIVLPIANQTGPGGYDLRAGQSTLLLTARDIPGLIAQEWYGYVNVGGSVLSVTEVIALP